MGTRRTADILLVWFLAVLAGSGFASGPGRAEVAVPAPVNVGDAEATAALLDGDGERTRFRLSLDKGVTAEIYTLSNPYRVIIDLPSVTFRLAEGTGRSGVGLITAFRYGLFAEGKARVVLDASGPVRINRAAMAASREAPGRQDLDVELIRVSPEEFGAGTGASRPSPAGAHAAAQSAAQAVLPGHDLKKSRTGRPIVVIDAGHGGIDGGAVGLGGQIEKNIVLAVAKELEQQLRTRGKTDVRLTRSADVFMSLDRRLEVSREAGADLFISLHADSLAELQFAGVIRGATVYTLSGKASNEEARRMAEKENASDLLAGIDTGSDEEGDEVKGILIDLMKRETANYSRDFSNVLAPRLARAIPLQKDGQRSAAFKVLKQTHAPSVLVELGYMSHPEDQRLLASPAWQKKVAGTIADAIEAFFAKRAGLAP